MPVEFKVVEFFPPQVDEGKSTLLVISLNAPVTSDTPLKLTWTIAGGSGKEIDDVLRTDLALLPLPRQIIVPANRSGVVQQVISVAGSISSDTVVNLTVEDISDGSTAIIAQLTLLNKTNVDISTESFELLKTKQLPISLAVSVQDDYFLPSESIPLAVGLVLNHPVFLTAGPYTVYIKTVVKRVKDDMIILPNQIFSGNPGTTISIPNMTPGSESNVSLTLKPTSGTSDWYYVTFTAFVIVGSNIYLKPVIVLTVGVRLP